MAFVVEGLTYVCHLCFLCPRSDYFSTLLAWRLDARRAGGALAAEAQRPVVLEEARSSLQPHIATRPNRKPQNSCHD